jgi:hypothetical protein
LNINPTVGRVVSENFAEPDIPLNRILTERGTEYGSVPTAGCWQLSVSGGHQNERLRVIIS